MSDVVKQYYNREYYYTSCGNYDEFRNPGKYGKMAWAYRRAAELAGVGADSKVLDIGCGRGEIMHICASRGALAYGIDYSYDAVEIAKEYMGRLEDIKARVRICGMDCRNLGFPDDSFTHVFMLDVVEHLHPEDLAKALSEAKRVMRKGGRLIIHTNPNRLHLDYGFKYYTRFVNMAANRIFGKNMWTRVSQLRTPKDKILHVNEQTYFSLKKNLKPVFDDYRVWLEFSFKEMPFWWKIMKSPSNLYPLSLFFPLNQIFCNWIWAVAIK